MFLLGKIQNLLMGGEAVDSRGPFELEGIDDRLRVGKVANHGNHGRVGEPDGLGQRTKFLPIGFVHRFFVAELDIFQAIRLRDAHRPRAAAPHSVLTGPLTYSMKSEISCGVSFTFKSGTAKNPAASQKFKKSTIPQPFDE